MDKYMIRDFIKTFEKYYADLFSVFWQVDILYEKDSDSIKFFGH